MITEVAIKDKLKATNGEELESKIVFVAAFKYVHDLAKKLLKKKRIKNLTNEDIQWIITVPAIWNDNAKYRMRQWAVDAGLVDPKIKNQCKIVYEPDCASLSLQYEIAHRKNNVSNLTADPEDDYKSYDEDAGSVEFAKDEKYILVDAGGGTTDIACHQILEGFGVKEVLHPSGGAWGSCYIDDRFVDVLKELFTEENVNEFKSEHPNIWTELMHKFEEAKTKFYQSTAAIRHNVRLPLDFLGFMEDKFEENDQDLDKLLSTKLLFGIKKLFPCIGYQYIYLHHIMLCLINSVASINDEYLELDTRIWQYMFNHVIDPTIKHIRKLLNEPKLMKGCKYLCMAGGLSTSRYFQSRMNKAFGIKSPYKLIIILPNRPLLSVVQGAAYFGITANYVKSRILRYTYGEIVDKSEKIAISEGIDSDYIAKNRYYCKYEKKWYVSRCFQVIARKNEEIHTGEIKKSVACRPDPSTLVGTQKIYYSNKDGPKIQSDGLELGTIPIEFDNTDDDRQKVIVEFHFYDTLIKIVNYKANKSDNKVEAYITNYS